MNRVRRFGGMSAAGATCVLAALAMLVSVGPNSNAQGTDLTPPTVVARIPTTGATGVSVLTTVSAVFSEPVQPATVVVELRTGGALVPSQVAYDAATRTATLDPDAALIGSRQYSVTVHSARDIAGNQMTSVSWTFNTASAGFVDQLLPQTGLTDPMVMAFASDGRMFVAEKSGRIQVFDNIDDPTGTTVADLRRNVYNFWDRGMMGMALHPSFPSVPYIYVLYAYDAVPGGTAPRWGSGATNPPVSDPCPSPPGPNTNGCVVTGRLSRLDVGNAASWPLDHDDEQPLVTDWFQQFPSHSLGSLMFGADGALYATGGDGASFTFADYGQTPSTPGVNDTGNNDPPQEGGALRSQDLRTSGDLVTLDGAVIRIDPETGLALADNPGYTTQSTENGKRIVAYGLRNPFRFTFRPGTSELWVGDVGWSSREEINRILDPTDANVDNMGWPCYEGVPQHGGYSGLPICQALIAQGASAVLAPYFSYQHQVVMNTGEPCGTGSSSISGLQFYSGGGYPATYQGALFFADYSRKCVWAMRPGGNGLPNTTAVELVTAAQGPVMLTAAPNGDILYAGFDDDRLHRIRYVGGNLPPTAAITANPTSGTAPFTVSFSAAGSSDPEAQALTYTWDLDSDGAFDDGTGLTASWTYTGAAAGLVNARVLVSDTGGQSAVAAISILVNGNRPTAVIDSPAGSLQWKVGDPITFAGRGLDTDEPGGQLPPSALDWEVNIHHCPSDCHVHVMQSFDGVATGSFPAPDHEYPSYLELRLTVTDPTGASDVTSVNIHPLTTTLSFATSPVVPLDLAVNGMVSTAPFSRTVIVGSNNSVNAISPQTIGQTTYGFSSWSDGLPALHNITASAAPASYQATYVVLPTTINTVTFPVIAGADDVHEEGTTFFPDSASAWLGTGAPGVTSVAGLRFANITIPKGAEILVARLEASSASPQWNYVVWEIGADGSPNSPPFAAALPPSQRTLLPARVIHESNDQWLQNEWHDVSGDIAPVLQQAIGQTGWASGNALSLVVRGIGEGWARKRVNTFEANPALAPRLVVTYRTAAPGPSLSIDDVSIVEGNSGTTNAVFTVVLAQPAEGGTASVDFATSNGTAVAPGDYTATNGTLTFSGATTTRTISVPIVGDTAVEGAETFSVTLSNPVGASIADDTGVGTITNDDVPPLSLSIGDASVVEGNAGTAAAVFTVTLSAAPGAATVNVNYATADDTAVAPGDYTATTGALSFTGSTTTRTITVPVIGDTALEATESFAVNLSLPVGAVIGDGAGTGTIVTDDVPPSLTISDAAVVEGQAGTVTATFTVTLSAPPGAAAVTVDFATANGTALAGSDYTATSGSLSFSGTTVSRTIPVVVTGDTTIEPTETFSVVLSGAVNAVIADASAAGTITNDDVPPPTEEQTVTFQVAGGGDDVYEAGASFIAGDPALAIGNGSLPGVYITGLRFSSVSIPRGAFIVSARLEVTASGNQWKPFAYEAAAEDAVNSAPFTEVSRPSQRPLLAPRVQHASNTQWVNNTWYALDGDLAPLVQAVVDQAGWTPNNALSVLLRGNGDAWSRKHAVAAEGAGARAPRLVVTYRTVPTGPTLAVADATIAEGNSGTTNAVFTVTLSAPPGATPVTVNYATANGTGGTGAVAPGDYTATSGQLSFSGSTTSQTISVPIVGDTAIEPTETFTVTLSAPVGATISDGSATGTITNDDLPTLSIADATVPEGNAGTTNAVFTVTLSAPPGASTVTVNYATANGGGGTGAVAPGDYTATSAQLSFSGSTTSQTISVPVVGDTAIEPTETFTVTLSSPVGATISDGSATGTITNDDVPPLPTLTIADVTVPEGNAGLTNAAFTVTLSAPPGASTVSVHYTTANGTATSPDDYTSSSDTLSFTGSTVSQTILVPIVGDTAVEPNETFTVTLDTPVGATIGDGSATGTITTEEPPPVPTLTIADVTMAEGNAGTTNAVFTVTLSAPPGASTVTVNYAVANGSAIAPGDYTAIPGATLSFTGSITTRTITVPVVGDTTIEPTETFTVTLSAPVGATISDGSATGTITNDDLPTLTIADATVTEGNAGTTNAVFTVTLSAPPGASTVTVNYATANGTAVAPGDYTAIVSGGPLSFTGSTTVQTITIPVVGETTVESTETFTVTLSSPVGATISDGSATGTITNDDGVPVEQTATFQISGAANDVHEEGTTFSTTASPLWVGNGQLPGPHIVGLRFTGVTIPAGATIVSARLEVTPASTQWNFISYEAGVEGAVASAPFTDTSRPSQRTLFTPRVLHSSNIQWVNNTWQALDGDLAPLLQLVVSQAGWTSGSPVSLVLRGDGPAWSRKRFIAADGTAARAPRLVVTYRAIP